MSDTQSENVLKCDPFYNLVALLGESNFNNMLLTHIEQWVKSQHFSIIKMIDDAPKILSCGTQQVDGKHVLLSCARDYSRQYFAHDQLFKQLTEESEKSQQSSNGFLLAEKIDSANYKKDIFDKHKLIQRLSGVYLDNENCPIIFNLYRHQDQGYYSDLEMENFQSMFPVLAKLLQGHFALAKQSRQQDLREALLLQQPLLTPQEVEVCVRILKGMSYLGIAYDLGLKEPTVKTYRNRAFEKLNINYKNQLFSLFM